MGSSLANRVFWWRDQVVGDYDDSSQETWLKERRIELVRASGTVREPGVIEAAGREIPYDKLVVATGSSSAAPPIPGLDELDYWTNREATGAKEVPQSLVVIGGGAVGCELSQAYRRLGADVDLVHVSERLLPREDPEASAFVAEAFREEGIGVHLCADTEKIACARSGERFRVELPDVEPLEAERLLIATGRKPTGRGPRAARAPDREVRDKGGRTDARRRERLGDRRRMRGRALHTRREVPGPGRSPRCRGEGGEGRLPRHSRGRVHGSSGCVGRGHELGGRSSRPRGPSTRPRGPRRTSGRSGPGS